MFKGHEKSDSVSKRRVPNESQKDKPSPLLSNHNQPSISKVVRVTFHSWRCLLRRSIKEIGYAWFDQQHEWLDIKSRSGYSGWKLWDWDSWSWNSFGLSLEWRWKLFVGFCQGSIAYEVNQVSWRPIILKCKRKCKNLRVDDYLKEVKWKKWVKKSRGFIIWFWFSHRSPNKLKSKQILTYKFRHKYSGWADHKLASASINYNRSWKKWIKWFWASYFIWVKPSVVVLGPWASSSSQNVEV